MSEFREKVQEIVNSKESLKKRERLLLELGLTKSDVSQILNKEYSVIRISSRKKTLQCKLKTASNPPKSSVAKCLAVRQPWATLILSGIKDVELRDAMIPPCNKFLIAASITPACKKLSDVMDGENLEIVERYISNGTLPPFEQWERGAILGYVVIEKATFDDVDSIWAEGHDGIKYVIKEAFVFDEPIRGKNKATPFFYNVDGIDTNNLPKAHKVKLKDL